MSTGILRIPGAADHKYTRGVVGVWAGSERYPGAAVLACSAAVRTGAGMVRISGPCRVEDLVLARRPEVVPDAGRCQAHVIGPGTDPASDPARGEELSSALRLAISRDLPAVIDAGALQLIPGFITDAGACRAVDSSPSMSGGCGEAGAVGLASGGSLAALGARRILTPHAGEAATLLTSLGHPITRAEVESRPAPSAITLAGLTGATVILKGTPTIVASSSQISDAGASLPPVLSPFVLGRGEGWMALDSGPGWLATAGSGDVLTGILGTVLAAAQADEESRRGAVEPLACAALAVTLHAQAGWEAARRNAAGAESGAPIAALDIAEAIPAVLARFLTSEAE